MQSQIIREKFSSFFIKNGHEKIKSSSLIPENDPTLLFTNAGMNQFKDYFTGKAIAQNKRAVTIQKVVRAGGKHNDLENVGFTARHHTFFEMLGNFSFGDYFKTEAIVFAWDFLTKELSIDPSKLYITVHFSDDEAFSIWNKKIGIPENRIFRMSDKTNFWEMGETGPCGPCTEIFFDHGEQFSQGIPEGGCLVDDEGRFVEIWNLVFMQFEKIKDQNEIKKIPLPKPSVDTGAGLERIAALMQGKYYNYDSDIFTPIFSSLKNLTGIDYYQDIDETKKSSLRVIADHIRSTTMLITDGAIPSNEGRGYVLRRIIRRAIRHLAQLNVKDVGFYKLVPSVFESLGKEYYDNMSNAALAERLLKLEEQRFRKTLSNGLDLIQNEIEKIGISSTFSGEVAFKLYDTYGFPLDLTETMLNEKNISLDHQTFDKCMRDQKEKSKKSSKFSTTSENLEVFYKLKSLWGSTHFVGYESESSQAKLLAKIEEEDKTLLVFDKTPFYGESGGQAGDSGFVKLKEGVVARITDTQKYVDDLYIHISQDADLLEEGQTYELKINSELREMTKKNHTATHLLQAALIKVLGPHIKQAGSSVGPDRLRFDFTHSEAMTPEQIENVESLVNNQIAYNNPVEVQLMTKDQANALGAMALFGEKYGDSVRVLSIGNFSCELCGGTHVNKTGDINLFKIIQETALASGVRRIEALTAKNALAYYQDRSSFLNQIEKELSSKGNLLLEKIKSFKLELKNKSIEIDQLKNKIQRLESKDLFSNSQPIANGMTFTTVTYNDLKDFKSLSDLYIDQHPKGVIFIHSDNSEKSSFLIRTHKSNILDIQTLTNKYLSLINGKGGGKKDLVQGSGDLSCMNTFITHLYNDLKQ